MKLAIFIYLGKDEETHQDCFLYQEQLEMFGSESWLVVDENDYSTVERIIEELYKDKFTVVTNSKKVIEIMERVKIDG